jgi:hypothetical protein
MVVVAVREGVPMSNRRETGRCLCGEVRFEAYGEPLWVAHCHCQSCRRSTGAPVTTFVGYRRDQVSVLGGERRIYESSPGVTRRFCGRCGTPLSYEADRFAGEIHLYVCTLDAPDRFKPGFHVHFGEKVAWLDLHDDLPRYARSGRGVEPSSWGPLRR